MATEAYDVVRSIKELVQSKQVSDTNKVSLALQAMQFAQTKKMQNIQLAGTQLDMLQKANAQISKSSASQFINDTGFGFLYSPTEDEDERTSAVTDAVETLTKAPNINKKTGENKGGYGFSGEDANRIVTAMWAHKAGSHDEILSIADELNTKLTSTKALDAKSDKFVKSFMNGGYISIDEYTNRYEESGNLKNAAKAFQNTKSITAEIFEMGTGDFKIQRDISMGDVSDSGKNMELLVGEFMDRGETMVDRQPSIAPQVKELKDLSTSISDKEKNKSLIEIELVNLTELSKSNLASTEQLERLDSIPLQIETFDEDISDLNEKIIQKNKDLSVSSALSAKEALQQTETEIGKEWANEVNIKELSELLAGYDPSIMEDVTAGRPGSIFWESMSYGGKLEDAPMGTKFKLWNLAKKIEESKTIGDIKSGTKNFTEKFNKPAWK